VMSFPCNLLLQLLVTHPHYIEARAQKRLITHSFALALNVMRETMKFILYVCSFLFCEFHGSIFLCRRHAVVRGWNGTRDEILCDERREMFLIYFHVRWDVLKNFILKISKNFTIRST
jgi:hypothetical protein